jgi:hypothetical protein
LLEASVEIQFVPFQYIPKPKPEYPAAGAFNDIPVPEIPESKTEE